jgi:thiol:disulfide interchange protein DsbC
MLARSVRILVVCATIAGAFLITLPRLGAAGTAPATPGTPPADAKADPRIAIAKKLGTNVEEIRPSVIPGLYEVAHGTEVLYITPDGHYLISGDVYDVERKLNLTEQRRSAARAVMLGQIGDDQTIVFGPPNPKYTVTVFTDVDCAFCRKLHSQIGEYNKLGIRIRYAFFPRTGPNTASWHKAEAVWCSANRQDALTRAKLGQDIQAKQCQTPVAKTYALGQELGMHGTPGIFTDRGEYITGYVTPTEMLARLKTEGEGATAKN